MAGRTTQRRFLQHRVFARRESACECAGRLARFVHSEGWLPSIDDGSQPKGAIAMRETRNFGQSDPGQRQPGQSRPGQGGQGQPRRQDQDDPRRERQGEQSDPHRRRREEEEEEES